MNRDKENGRSIQNFEVIMESLRTKFPTIFWENFRSTPSLQQNAVSFNTFRLFLAVHGAGMISIMHMQRNSVVCELQTDKPWTIFAQISLFSDYIMCSVDGLE
jgi:hypothetical protein